jgi:hypothetical protein
MAQALRLSIAEAAELEGVGDTLDEILLPDRGHE